MKKILTLFTVLCMTLMFTGCTKTVKLEDIDSANFTEDILSIKCINTLEEMMNEDFEPKFEISNNYKEGNIPYFNFDFDKKDEVNNIIKAYILNMQATKCADKLNEGADISDPYLNDLGISIKYFKHKDYLFMFFDASEGMHIECNSLCIDLANKKLLTKEEVLKINNYNLDENKDKICDLILADEYYDDIEDKELLFSIIKESTLNIDLYVGNYKSDNNFNLKEFGKVDSYFDYFNVECHCAKETLFNVNSKNEMFVSYYINEADELVMILNCNLSSIYRPIYINLNTYTIAY